MLTQWVSLFSHAKSVSEIDFRFPFHCFMLLIIFVWYSIC